jgi:ribosomal protein S18 acetylase RimI-like enzyme
MGLVTPSAANLPPIPVTIRPFAPGDEEVCRRLYNEGILSGRLADNDTGVDIDDIQGAYLSTGGNFWLAINPEGEVVGMIGVQQHESVEGEIRRLRVRSDSRRRGIGTAMLETAIKFCREKQYLKVTLDTFMDREPAVSLFQKFKFRHSRTREVGDKTLLYFYLDLYSSDSPKRAS